LLAQIFMALNAFIVLFVAGTMMFSSFKPETFKKLLYLALGLITLPVITIAIANQLGFRSHLVMDLLLMRGGSIGIPTTFGYGIALGLMLNKLRITLFPPKERRNEKSETDA